MSQQKPRPQQKPRLELPKSIEIGGCKVKIVPGKAGGEINIDDGICKIDPKLSLDNQRQYLMHEILEGIMMNQRRRFANSDGKQMFVLSHDELDVVAQGLYAALKPFLRLSRVDR